LPGDRLQHVAAACRVMSLAGELTARQVAGPGSFVAAFLDMLWTLEVKA
jgi:hydroxyethylthiazole kinase